VEKKSLSIEEGSSATEKGLMPPNAACSAAHSSHRWICVVLLLTVWVMKTVAFFCPHF
jgi:hypothetical protein